MARIGIFELLESPGLKDYSTSGHQARAVFHYEPLLRLYRLEVPSLFGRLLRDEGVSLDRADPHLFEAELDKLLAEFGPLIWPAHGQGPRDHLLEPTKGSRYTSDLVYPKDKIMQVLVGHLRSLILSKRARPDIDIDALVEKRHKDATLKIFNKPQLGHLEARQRKSNTKPIRSKSGEGVGNRQQVSLTDQDSELTEVLDASSSDSEDPVISRSARGWNKAKSEPFQVALRLYRKTSSEEPQHIGPCYFYGTTFLVDDLDTLEKCFAHICHYVGANCTYMEFHLPEDMSLEGRIRIDRRFSVAKATFQRVLNMLQGARKFPGEPSYRTVEVEIGAGTLGNE